VTGGGDGATASVGVAPGPVRSARSARSAAQVRQAVALVKAAIDASPPQELSGPEARQMAELLGSLGKLVAASVVRYSRCSGRDHVGLLAAVQGTSVAKAKAGISLLDRVSKVPEVRDAFSDGRLSMDQAAVISSVTSSVPEAAGPLVAAAESVSVNKLKQEAARTLQRARGEESQAQLERRLHARRFCRLSFPEGGGVRLEAFFSPLQGARVKSALEKTTSALFEEAWAAGRRDESIERLRADALASLVCGTRVSATGGTPEVLVRIDAGALRRGEVRDGELCEIDGVGPISVTAARSLMGEGFFTLLVEDGRDICTVTSTNRTVPRRVRKALMLRDEHCVVPGCAATQGLQIDHWGRDYGWGGPTALDNLCRLCSVHHKMKTEQGWRLLGGPDAWRWLRPRTVPELAADGARRQRAPARAGRTVAKPPAIATHPPDAGGDRGGAGSHPGSPCGEGSPRAGPL